MVRKRKSYSREYGTRRYRRMFRLVCEGEVTEPQYFEWLENIYDQAIVKIQVAKKKKGKSAPDHLIKCAREESEKTSQKGDQVWIIVDVDSWTDEQFNNLSNWSKEKEENKLAISNPKFEYWVLLHGQDDPKHCLFQECSKKFRDMMGDDKKINPRKLSEEGLRRACKRAKEKQVSSESFETCGSTVYTLI